MNYRSTKLLAEKSLSGSGVESIPINVLDPISRLVMGWRTTKSKHGMDSYPHKDVTRIELVDGSEVLHSLDGGQNQALAIYDRKCPSMNHGQHLSASSEYATFGIDFGRFLFDPLLAFDPKKFRNPVLKVSYDVDVADTGVTAGLLEVWAECFDEKIISPMGFLSAKEIMSYTCAAENSYEYIDLPTDYVMRKMLIQGYRKAYEPWNVISEARLSEDNEKRIPFDWNLETYYRTMKGVWTPIVEQLQGVGGSSGNRTFYVTPTEYYTMALGIIVGDGTMRFNTWQRGGAVIPYTSEAAPFFQGMIFGYLPNHCFEFAFGDPQDMGDWYDVTRIGNLRLRLKAGGSGTDGKGKVVTQQLRRY